MKGATIASWPLEKTHLPWGECTTPGDLRNTRKPFLAPVETDALFLEMAVPRQDEQQHHDWPVTYRRSKCMVSPHITFLREEASGDSETEEWFDVTSVPTYLRDKCGSVAS